MRLKERPRLGLTKTLGRDEKNIRSRLGVLHPLIITEDHRVKHGEQTGVQLSLQLVGGGGAAAGHCYGDLVPRQVVD